MLTISHNICAAFLVCIGRAAAFQFQMESSWQGLHQPIMTQDAKSQQGHKMHKTQKMHKDAQDHKMDKTHKMHKDDPSEEWFSEGGEFARFFNNRVTGRGINKWVDYFPAYWRHFKQFIGKDVHIVEVGIQSGGSLEMWRHVFGPKARVYGVDINVDTKAYENNYTKILIGDQGDPKFWKSFKEQVPHVDIFIDDGGHTVPQQIISLGNMLPHLSANGIYMTEDIHGANNPFWKTFKFPNTFGSNGDEYAAMAEHVGSIHIYPFLLVIEKTKGLHAVSRQLGTTQQIMMHKSLPNGSLKELAQLSGWPKSLFRKYAGKSCDGSDHQVLTTTCLKSVPKQGVIISSKDSQSSLVGSWPEGSFERLQAIFQQTRELHSFDTMDWKEFKCTPNAMQTAMDSVHVYPNFLVAKRTLTSERPISAPKKGTQWIPYKKGTHWKPQ